MRVHVSGLWSPERTAAPDSVSILHLMVHAVSVLTVFDSHVDTLIDRSSKLIIPRLIQPMILFFSCYCMILLLIIRTKILIIVILSTSETNHSTQEPYTLAVTKERLTFDGELMAFYTKDY